MTTLGIVLAILCIAGILYIIRNSEAPKCTGNCCQGRCPCDCRGKE